METSTAYRVGLALNGPEGQGIGKSKLRLGEGQRSSHPALYITNSYKFDIAHDGPALLPCDLRQS